MNQSRYPGAKPFETNQAHVFFGRDDDNSRLHRLVRVEPLVVLYAKSGMGKSSLINAGLIPAVYSEGEFEPLSIRFQAWTEGKADAPADITCRAVAPEGSATTFLDTLIPDEPSLWHHLKESQIEGRRKFLLIFDQFEELFTYPEAAVRAFKNDLAEALYAKIPQRYRDLLERQIENGSLQLSDNQFTLLQSPPDVRVVMVIRSDRMSLLNSLTDFLPTVLKNCFELPPLSLEAAERAILEPARSRIADFATPPFDFAPDAVRKITDFLTQNESERVESTQLQIICQSVERKITAAGQLVSASDLGDLNSVIENYYYDQLAQLGNDSAQLPARRLIEEGLVFEEEERRLSLYEGQIFKTYGISPEALSQLVNAHLLRAEPSLHGGYTYELSHDTLVAPVLKAKRKRFEIEQQLHMLKQQQLREQELVEARRVAAHERNRRQRANLTAAAAVIGLIVAATAGWWAFQQKLEAEHQRQAADKALFDYKTAQAAREKLEFQNDLLRMNDILNAGYCPPKEMLDKMRQVQAAYSDDSVLQDNIRQFKNRLNVCGLE